MHLAAQRCKFAYASRAAPMRQGFEAESGCLVTHEKTCMQGSHVDLGVAWAHQCPSHAPAPSTPNRAGQGRAGFAGGMEREQGHAWEGREESQGCIRTHWCWSVAMLPSCGSVVCVVSSRSQPRRMGKPSQLARRRDEELPGSRRMLSRHTCENGRANGVGSFQCPPTGSRQVSRQHQQSMWGAPAAATCPRVRGEPTTCHFVAHKHAPSGCCRWCS